MIKKVGEFEFPRVLDEFRLMRRSEGGANWSKRVNLASKQTRVENDMEPLRILFFSNNLVSTAMTLVSTMKVNSVIAEIANHRWVSPMRRRLWVVLFRCALAGNYPVVQSIISSLFD